MKIKLLILAILCSIYLAACTGNEQSTKNLQPIEINEMISFSEQRPNTLQVLANQEDILSITNSINSAKKLDGKVDMADPHYHLKVGKSNYYLWVNQDHTATIMNVNDTNTIYRIYAAEKFISTIQQ
ncbi:hypothetical protein [Solibacillus sp. FSL K6-1523]|uniref:hypothetical protein n=1 Tax=Solibacillus sp. FSL K6-1523 TaxID=2921471 RepID=UPI0030F8BF42